LLNQIVANPRAYGFTNVTDPCFNGTTVCTNPDRYLYWDDIHPTTAADAILAANFRGAVTPEPSSIVFLGSGVAGLASMLMRRRKISA
jgi:phospholipase/lecithinase/hemolysin